MVGELLLILLLLLLFVLCCNERVKCVGDVAILFWTESNVVGKTRNIALKDPYDRNLLETFIANQQMLLAGQQRIEQLIDQRLNAMEAQLCSALKKPEKDVPELFTEKQLIKMTQYTRQTLYKVS